MDTLLPQAVTDAEFLQIFNRLCVALREPADDTGVTQSTYFEALRDLSMAALERGALALMKEPGRRFFPTTAEWRQAAAIAYESWLRDTIKPARAEPWHHECDSCEDSGWVYHECARTVPCGRNNMHASHFYVRVCPCRETNRTYQRNQLFGAGA